MKYKDFEKELSSMFNNSSMEVDVDMLIDNIHSKSVKKKRGIMPWISLCFVLAVLCLIGFNVVMENNQTKVSITENQSLTKNSISAKPTRINEIDEKELEKQSTVSDRDLQKNNSYRAKKTRITSTSIVNSRNIFLSNPINDNDVFIPLTKEETELNNSSGKHSNHDDFVKTKSKLIAELRPLESIFHSLEYERDLSSQNNIDCPTFSRKTKWHIDLIPELGYILPLKTLSNTNSEPSRVFDMRLAGENSLEGIQAALYARIIPGNAPFYLKLGASYTKLTERMNLNTTYTVSDTMVGIISITESQNGDTLTVIHGDIITDSTFTRISKDHYSLQLIDIPVAIGFSHSIGKGWRIGGELGAQFNISLSTNGKLLEGSGQNSYTNLPASGRFAPNVGVSFFTGLTIEKVVSSNSSFYISPRFRYFPNSFTPDSYNVRQEYQFVGVHTGYIFSF